MTYYGHVALCLVLCCSSTHVEVWVSYTCLLHLNVKRYSRFEDKMRAILMCPHQLDVALCSITVKNGALNFSLVGHP